MKAENRRAGRAVKVRADAGRFSHARVVVSVTIKKILDIFLAAGTNEHPARFAFQMLKCTMRPWQKMTVDRDCSTTANSTTGWLTSYFRGGSSSGSAFLCSTADRPRVLGRRP